MSSSMRNWSPYNGPHESQQSSPNSKSHRNRKDSEAVFSLYVAGIPPEFTQNALKNLFATYGYVTHARISPSKLEIETHIGFIDYISKEEATNAIANLNGYKLGKYMLKVSFAHQKKSSENNYSKLLQRLENGPLVEGDLKSLMQKAENEFSQRPFPSSAASCSGDFRRSGEKSNMQFGKFKNSPPHPQRQLVKSFPHKAFQPQSYVERTNNSFAKSKSSDQVGSFKKSEDEDWVSDGFEQPKTQLKGGASGESQRGIDRNKTVFRKNRRPFEKITTRNQNSVVKRKQTSVENEVPTKQTEISNASSNSKSDTGKKGKPCEVCHAITPKICGSCSVTRYCSQACQSKDWPTHKHICKQLKEDSLDTDEPLVVVEDALCDSLSRLLEKTLSKQEKNVEVAGKNHTSPKRIVKTTLEPFSPEVKVGTELDVLVIDVNSESGVIGFQIHDQATSANLNNIQVTLNASLIAKTPSPLISHTVGDACACQFSEDDQWYRAVIKQVNTDKTALVRYVDYGNSEVVQLSKLMLLDASFCQNPVFCMQCKLAGYDESTSWSKTQIEFLGTSLQETDGVLKAKFEEITGDMVYVHLKFGDVSINEKMKELSRVESSERKSSIESSKNSSIGEVKEELNDITASSNLVSSLSNSSALPEQKFPLHSVKIPEGRFLVLLSFVESPSHFYCQIANDDLLVLHEALENLTGYFASNQRPFTPVVGQLCSAVYAEDSKWCRAKVLDATKPDLFLVHYIDYGNKAEVPMQNIQPLPAKFALPTHTFQASLASCFPSPGLSWSSEAITFLKNFENDSCIAEVKQMNDDEADIILCASEESVSLNQLLVSSELAVAEKPKTKPVFSSPPADETKTIEKKAETAIVFDSELSTVRPSMQERLQVSISSIDDNGFFYCQLIHEELLALAELVENLTSYCDANQITRLDPPPSAGMYCTAFYASEGTWNRAVVLPVTDTKMTESENILVRFVDYGNSEFVSKDKIQPLPEKFASLPIQAVRCSLADVKPFPGPEWKEEVNTELKSFMEIMPIEAQFIAEKDGQYMIKIPVLVNQLIKKEIAEYTF